MRENAGISSENTWSMGRDLKSGPPEFGESMLTILLLHCCVAGVLKSLLN
jgi:hypothetical protein